MPVPAAVLFDLDDTLFDHQHAARCALAEILKRCSLLQAKALEELEAEDYRLIGEIHLDVLAGRLRVEEARIVRIRALVQWCGGEISAGEAEEIAILRRNVYREHWQAVSGAIALLERLKKDTLIGVVTNNFVEEQTDKLRACGLESLIDVMVTSEEAGYTKPAPEIFQLTLQRLNCREKEAIMVGDSWEVDVIGARNAGIRAVWFNRRRFPRPGDAEVLEIESFEPVEHVTQLIQEFPSFSQRRGGCANSENAAKPP